MEKADKEKEVQFIQSEMEQSQVTLCADYRGLTVAQITEVRKAFRESGTSARVVKNTLSRLAATNALGDGDEGERAKFLEMLKGPSFLVFGKEDAVAAAKTIEKFSKSFGPFEIKGAWFDGKFLSKDDVVELSKMPSREEVLGTLVALINTPATQMVRLLQAPGAQLVQLLEAYRAKLAG